MSSLLNVIVVAIYGLKAATSNRISVKWFLHAWCAKIHVFRCHRASIDFRIDCLICSFSLPLLVNIVEFLVFLLWVQMSKHIFWGDDVFLFRFNKINSLITLRFIWKNTDTRWVQATLKWVQHAVQILQILVTIKSSVFVLMSSKLSFIWRSKSSFYIVWTGIWKRKWEISQKKDGGSIVLKFAIYISFMNKTRFNALITYFSFHVSSYIFFNSNSLII